MKRIAYCLLLSCGYLLNSQSFAAPSWIPNLPLPPPPQELIAAPTPYRFDFVDGAKLVIDPANGVSRVETDGSLTPLINGPLTQFPSSSKGKGGGTYVLAGAARMAYFEVNRKIKVITCKGQLVDLPTQRTLAEAKEGKVFLYTKVKNSVPGAQGNQNFMVLSVAYAAPSKYKEFAAEDNEVGGLLNFGETFVIRDDGKFLRSDFRLHSPNSRNSPTIVNNIVTFVGNESAREIDLEQFDKEAEYVVPQMSPVADKEGVKSDPGKILASFTTNLTADMRDKTVEYQPLEGESLHNFRRALAKKELGSAVVLGPAGSGKTETIERFINEVKLGHVPELPRSTAFIGVDAASLGGGSKYTGTMESRIDAMVKACQMQPLVLVIDEIHSLVGQGTHRGNSNDFFQWLKPHLAAGRVKILGMSTSSEFFRAFSFDTALLERFQVIEQQAPNREQALEIYGAWARKNNRPAPDTAALERLYRNSEKFNPIGAQPRKGLRILIDAFADLDIKGEKRAPTVTEVDRATARVHNVNPADFDLNAVQRKLVALPALLDAQVIGQNAAKRALIQQAVSSMVGTNDPNKPRMSTLLAGPKGIGKTDLALAYAQALGLPAERIMMNSFSIHSQPEELLVTIKQALEKNAFTVFAVDEFDKGPIQMQNALLDILDKGQFSLAQTTHLGVKVAAAEVSARNASFILIGNYTVGANSTANLGFTADRINTSLKSEAEADEGLRQKLAKAGLSEYILDRVQEAISLETLSREEFRAVLKLHLAKVLNEQSAVHERELTVTDSEVFLDQLTEKLYEPGLSNRTALRILNRGLRLSLAQNILANLETPAAPIALTGLSTCESALH